MTADAPAALSPILGPATQLGFVVRDVEAAVRHWIEVFGIGPFVVMEHGTSVPPPVTYMRGRPVSVELKLAFGFSGDVQIELIEQTNDAPSPYTEFLAGGREGLQHLGYWVHDHAAATQRVEAAGYRPVYEIRVAGQELPIVYYESPSVLGPMLELVPPKWRRSREAIRTVTAAWKGGEPGDAIRHLFGISEKGRRQLRLRRRGGVYGSSCSSASIWPFSA